MWFIFLTVGCSQNSSTPSVDYFQLIRPEFTGKLAYETTDYVEDYWRVVGNTGFNNTIFLIADTLKAAGYVLEENASSTDRLTYRIEKRGMNHQTWEPVSAALQIVGSIKPLLQSTTNRNMTYLNSASTPDEGVKAEIVWITNLAELQTISFNGKIAYTELSARKISKTVFEKGGLGIITYDNPDYLQPKTNKTSIQFRSLQPQDSTKFWGIALSYEANEQLKQHLEKGKTEVLVNIQTNIYPSEELTLVANIKGAIKPDERLVFSAHIQEPGANDNASGVGAQLEMAKVAAKMFKNETIEFDRTMTFLWGDEIVSTRRYIEEDLERAKGIKWGISLDMVGENTDLTGGSFLIEKMPDPSAIWTRGADKHTEWGGEVLSLDDMKPHYLNDFILSTFKEQGKFANWKVDTNPFEGGSDHAPFLDSNIPGLLLWHFTDQFYHTDNDRIDKVSQTTLKNVGTAALVSGLKLVNADANFAKLRIDELKSQATLRLREETALSKKAMANKSTIVGQTQLLEAWGDWYIKALATINDIVEPNDAETQNFISETQKEIELQTKNSIQQLKE